MKKNLVMFTSVFASLAILSTGFAAWVISGGEEQTKEIGDIVVDTVQDNRHKLTIDSADTDTENSGKIIFGRPEKQEKKDAWLKSDSNDKIEKLSTFFKVTVTNAAGKAINSIFETNTFVEDVESEVGDYKNVYTTAASTTKQYVGDVPGVEFVSEVSETITTTDTLARVSDSSEDGVVYIRLKFSWGTHFDGKNPYEFYNEKKLDDTIAKDAVDALTAMQTLSGAKFKLTLKTKA